MTCRRGCRLARKSQYTFSTATPRLVPRRPLRAPVVTTTTRPGHRRPARARRLPLLHSCSQRCETVFCFFLCHCHAAVVALSIGRGDVDRPSLALRSTGCTTARTTGSAVLRWQRRRVSGREQRSLPRVGPFLDGRHSLMCGACTAHPTSHRYAVSHSELGGTRRSNECRVLMDRLPLTECRAVWAMSGATTRSRRKKGPYADANIRELSDHAVSRRGSMGHVVADPIPSTLAGLSTVRSTAHVLYAGTT